MNCLTCNQTFSNQNTHRPRILISCGHSLCEACIEASFCKQKIICKQCGSISSGNSLNNFPINATLLSMIQEGMNTHHNQPQKGKINDMCSIHNQKLEAYCQKDNELLCLSCVIGNQHKSHKITQIAQKVQKDRNILKDCFKKILLSKEEIKQICKTLQDGLQFLSLDYKDSIFDIGIAFKHIAEVLKEAQQKCLQKCQVQYQNNIKKLELKLEQFVSKVKFYEDLQQIYEQVINLPNIEYLSEDTKRIFIVQNCKFKKPKNLLINEFINQNKLGFNKLNTYNQMLASLQELASFQKKIQSQGTPSMKTKKSKNAASNREPTVLQVNLNEQYRKHYKNTSQIPYQTVSKLKTSFSNCENGSQIQISCGQVSERNSKNKLSKSVRTSKAPQNKSNYRKKVSVPKHQDEHSHNKSMFSMQSDISGFIPAEAINSFMGNSQVSLHQQELSQTNQSFSLSFKDTDAQFTLMPFHHKIFHFGGFNNSTYEVMNLQEGNNSIIREKASKIDKKMQIHRSKAQCVLIQSYNPHRCLILGGKSPTEQKIQSILEFDIISNQPYESILKLSQPKSGFGCVTKDDRIFIAGGSNPNKSLKLFEQYRIGCIGFTKTDYPSMNFSRDELGMVLGHDGNIYACGGINQLGMVLNSFERYNWEKSRWEILPSMKKPRRSFSLISVPHGIYAIGGYDGTEYLNEVQFFQFKSNKWTMAPQMMRARFAHTALTTPDMQNIIVFGGFNKQPLKQTQIYNILQEKWTIGPNLCQERFLHCSIFLNV